MYRTPTPTRRELLEAAGATAVGATIGVDATRAQSGPSAAGTWPSFGYDAANTGHNPGTTGPRADVGSVWSFSPDNAVRSTPAVANVAAGESSSGTTVYVGSSADAVHALDPTEGTEQWRFETDRRVVSSPAVRETDDGGTVYVGSDDGFLYAIDAVTGQREWQFETGGPVTSSPTVLDRPGGGLDGPVVYVGSDDSNVYAVDAATGTERWRVQTPQDAVKTTPAAVGVAPDAGPDATGTVYVGSDDGRVYALDAATGGGNWRVGTGSPLRASPVVADGSLYVATQNGTVRALDPDTGTKLWEFDTGDLVVATPAVRETDDGGTVYVGARNGTLYAVSTADGTEQWTVDAGDTLVFSAPTVAEDTVYFGTDAGMILGVAAGSGEVRWQFDADLTVQSSPVVVSTGDGSAASRVYVGSGATGIGGGSLLALAEGASSTASGVSAPGNTTAPSGNNSGLLQYLSFPAAIVSFVGVIAGVLYAAGRAGLLETIEDTADAYGPDPGEFEDDEDNEDEDGGDDTTPVWDLVVDDVVARAEQTDRTATEDLLVTKYVDHGTFDAPLVAYELASYRDDPARVRLTESLFDEGREDSRPLGDGWTVEDDRLVFERVLDPDEELQTIVGRPDCPEDRLDDLLDRPEIGVEDLSDAED